MAGRIPDSFVDDLLARTDLVELVGRSVRLKRSGKNYSACCPFHQEKTPSFTVSPEKQFYYCFGCGASGNAISFLMDHNRLEFVEAVEELAKSLSLEVPREDQQREQRQQLKPLFDVLEQATVFFEQQLRDPEQKDRPIAYLKKRGLSGQTAARFRLGFAPPGWDNLSQQLGQTPQERQRLLQTGLLVDGNSSRKYDRFRDRIMFPIRDHRGRVIAFGGRVLGNDKPKYLNSPETPVFHKGRELYGLYEARQANQKLTRIIVVEGYMDVIALAQHGITWAVATLGTATSLEQVEKLFRHCEQLVFCFDGDNAGRKAAWRALENALPAMKDGRQIQFLLLPEGEDPDSLVRAQGTSYFEGLLNESTPLSEFFYQHLGQDLNLNSMDGRARLASLAAPLLSRLPQGVFVQLMKKRLAQLTQLDEQELRVSMQNAAQQGGSAQFHSHKPGGRYSEGRANSGQGKPISKTSDSMNQTGPEMDADQDYSLESSSQDYYEAYSGSDQNPAYDDGYYESLASETQQPDLKSGNSPPSSKAGSVYVKRPRKSGGMRPARSERLKPEELSIVDATIRLVLNGPRALTGLQVPPELQALQLPRMGLLLELIDYIQRKPEASTAAILGHWQNREGNEAIFQLAAKEFLTPGQEDSLELQDALARLRLLKVEQDLDQIIAAGVEDKRKFQELLQLQRELSEQKA